MVADFSASSSLGPMFHGKPLLLPLLLLVSLSYDDHVDVFSLFSANS
jgi:hypothetical protein